MVELFQALAAYAATCNATCCSCGCEHPETQMCDGCGNCNQCCTCPSPEPEPDPNECPYYDADRRALVWRRYQAHSGHNPYFAAWGF